MVRALIAAKAPVNLQTKVHISHNNCHTLIMHIVHRMEGQLSLLVVTMDMEQLLKYYFSNVQMSIPLRRYSAL